MRHPTPVLALLRRAHRANKALAAALDESRDETRVQTRRAEAWRKTALEMAPRIGPGAMDLCLLQVAQDELRDEERKAIR